MSEWNVWSVDTVTGDRQLQLPMVSFPWARALNGGRSGSGSLIPVASGLSRAVLRELTNPVSRTLVLSWGETVVYAGTIWSRTFDVDSGLLTLSHADVWSILKRRWAVNHYESVVALWEQTYSSMTLRQFVKYLMVLGLYGPVDANMMLPITLPADDSAGTITRTVYGYHLAGLVDSLEDVMNEANGPDVDFRPRWVNGKLNWEMRVGSTAAPKLTDGAYEWNLGAEQSGMFEFTETENADKLVTSMVAVGEGQGTAQLARTRRILSPPYPHLERSLSFSQEPNVVTLDQLALGGLNTYSTPTTQTGFSVMADGIPKVTDLLPGGTATVWVPEHPWLEPGPSVQRLVGFSGDLGRKVKLEFQPDGGV